MNAGYVAGKDLGYIQYTLTTTPITLTAICIASGMAGLPIGLSRVTIVPETQAFRWRSDGVNPSATVGMPIAVGGVFNYDLRNIPLLTLAAQVNGCILNIQLEGQS